MIFYQIYENSMNNILFYFIILSVSEWKFISNLREKMNNIPGSISTTVSKIPHPGKVVPNT